MSGDVRTPDVELRDVEVALECDTLAAAASSSAKPHATLQRSGTSHQHHEQYKAQEAADLQRKVEDVDVEQLKRKALAHRIATACTSYKQENDEGDRYEWRPLWGTTPTTLGVYGVGVQLYFEFLFFMGIVFGLLFILSMPLLAITVQGSLIEDNLETKDSPFAEKLMALFSVANLGSCKAEACRSFDSTRMQAFGERPLFDGSEAKVKDYTEALGTLDGMCLLMLLSFGAWFHQYWIPRTVAKQDENHVTAADYTVQVIGLPRRLEEQRHHDYEALLKQHFLKVLAQVGVEEYDLSSAVQEVALIREYDGAIKMFMTQGGLLKQRENVQALRALALNAGENTEAEKHEKKESALLQRINGIETRLAHQADKRDEDREVCSAYVMFKSEEYKHMVLERYQKSESVIGRVFQPRRLRFLKHARIRVIQACEPDDLYWENLDFSSCRHRMRKWIGILIAVGLLVSCVVSLVWFRSFKYSGDDFGEVFEGTLVIQNSPDAKPQHGCMEMCGLELYKDAFCSPEHRIDIEEARDKSGATVNLSQCWRSPSCTNATWYQEIPDAKAQDWIQLRFNYGIGCFKFNQPASGTLNRLQLYHCYDHDDGTAINNFETECSRYRDVKMKRTSALESDSFVGSGRLYPALDTGCSQQVTLESAKHHKSVRDAREDKNQPADEQEDTIALNCFCQQQDLSDPAFRLGGDSETQKVCKEWIWSTNVGMAFVAIGVCGVLVLNQLLLVFFMAIDTFSRYKTSTVLATTQMGKVFFAQLCNTGIATFVVSLNMRGSLAMFPFVNIMGNGSYDDLTIAWFVQVGTGLFLTISGQAVCVLITPIAWAKFVDPLLLRLNTKGQVIQSTLDDAYTLPEWAISLRTAETMNVIVCVFIYAGGMPLLYLAGLIYCVLAYWVDKWTLLRASCKPPRYNEETLQAAVLLLPFAGLLHTVFALVIFGNQELFPSGWAGITGVMERMLGVTREQYTELMDVYPYVKVALKNQLFMDYVHARTLDFAREGCWLLLIVLVAFMAYHFITCLSRTLFRPCWSPLKALLKAFFIRLRLRKLQVMMHMQSGPDGGVAEDDYIQAKLMAEKTDQLFSYKLEANKRYYAAYQALGYDPEPEDVVEGSAKKSGMSTNIGAYTMAAGAALDTLEERIAQAEHRLMGRVEKALGCCFTIHHEDSDEDADTGRQSGEAVDDHGNVNAEPALESQSEHSCGQDDLQEDVPDVNRPRASIVKSGLPGPEIFQDCPCKPDLPQCQDLPPPLIEVFDM